MKDFGTDFWWGAGTSAYQVEGATRHGARTPSIWDTFTHLPGTTERGETGDAGAEHFERWQQDVALAGQLGLRAYRLSISWTRVQPEPFGELDAAGVAFYRNLLESLHDAGIEPIVTLYHWDLPQSLEDAGGWPQRSTAEAFADYASRIAAALGNRVRLWLTINEPWCAAFLGYAAGVHAPGRHEPAAALAAAHHLNLAHGWGAAAIRNVLGEEAPVGIALNIHVTHPHDPESAADLEAVAQIDAVGNHIFLGPLLDGSYPARLLRDTAHLTDFSFVQPGDLQATRQRIDVLGINYYTTQLVAHHEGPGLAPRADGHGDSPHSPWVGAEYDVAFLAPPPPHTAMGWTIAPEALTELLCALDNTYPDLPLLVTENGAAFDDEVSPEGRVHDVARVAYLRSHIAALAAARRAGVDVRGYIAWSLLDNFEWAKGYAKRFGLLHVDYDTFERTPKDSARFYRRVIASGQLPDVTEAPTLPWHEEEAVG